MHPIDHIEATIVQTLLSEAVQAQYSQGNVAHRELTPYVHSIRQISERYVSHDVGQKLPSPITSPLDAAAYALYYTPINAAKILHLLPYVKGANRPISVLDLGCGPGTAGLALLAALERPIHLTCVESSQPMRATAERLLSSGSLRGNLQSLSMFPALPAQSHAPYDVIIAANVLAEIPEHEAYALLDTMSSLLAPDGRLLLLEPGQQHHTRRLMRMRDHILSQFAGLAPVFPCLHATPCPMLQQSSTDWCHGVLEWQQPRLHAQLDDLLGFNKHRIKYAGFVFQRGGSLGDGVRVLTPPRRTAAGVESLVCGDGIYGTIRIAKRNRSTQTRALEKADVFDRLLLSHRVLGDLPVDTVIERTPSTHPGSE